MSNTGGKYMSKEQVEKYRLVESRKLCTIYNAVPYDNDVDINPLEFHFIDENGMELDFTTYFEGTVILAAYEGSDKLYVIAEIPGTISHDIYLWVFERVE